MDRYSAPASQSPSGWKPPDLAAVDRSHQEGTTCSSDLNNLQTSLARGRLWPWWAWGGLIQDLFRWEERVREIDFDLSMMTDLKLNVFQT